ncbi:AMMECR1 domain-containing protein [Deltaproteobacteria bacterium OttesenSCG-928-K17]|nr:AMMECR1 domain-containing protein [Deltaproteobacteria bacterium OttesenSCG-928-K17]
MGKLPALSGTQKKTLMLIAGEALTATIENRPSREATVELRLMQPQPMVVSIYVDDELRARAWRLTELQPIYLQARDLTYLALSTPRVSKKPISQEELHRARISLAVLSNYTLITNEKDIPPRSAVIIYNGFTEWLTLPDDLLSTDPVERLEFTCRQAGLRPQVWLLPQTTIYAAEVEGTTQSSF